LPKKLARYGPLALGLLTTLALAVGRALNSTTVARERIHARGVRRELACAKNPATATMTVATGYRDTAAERPSGRIQARMEFDEQGVFAGDA
jgi:hypothetical protein